MRDIFGRVDGYLDILLMYTVFMVLGSVTQYGDKMKDVHCSPIQRMVIHKAHYGDFDYAGTFNISATIDMKCSRQASCQVKSLCGGNRSCELAIDNDLLLSYCSDTTKELYIEYTCVDNYTNPITTGNKEILNGFPCRIARSMHERCRETFGKRGKTHEPGKFIAQ